MFSSEDEQEDMGMFDQLKCIKPFTVDQLYLLHPDVGCPPKSAIVTEGDQEDETGYKSSQLDIETYQHLVEHGQLRNQLIDLQYDIKKLYKKTFANIDKAWTFKEESIRKIAMCQQGKIAETTFKYKQAHIDKKHLDSFAQGFNELIDKIIKDYIYYSFESQTKRNKIATQLSISYQTPDLEVRKAKLKSAITTLIEFVRYLGDTKSDLTTQCRKWLRTLSQKFLEEGSTNDYRFIISQLAKGPVGTADWSADLLECKPFEQTSGYESVPQYITHCSALLSELFYNLQLRIKHMKASSSLNSKIGEDCDTSSASPKKYSDQDWSLVDPRFSCTEELSISANCNNLLSESDVIKFCLRIPVAQIFRAYVKKCLDPSDEFRLETDKNYEYIMLKLLTTGTIIIKTYQIGLETFNSIQYGSLIEYLSSQIRRTVLILSDQWAEFKHRLKGVDDALLMRLQVEYDSFMLRSILVILELRESGIWRHLSRVERDTETRDSDANLHGWATDSLKPAFEKLLQVTGISPAQQANRSLGDSNQIAEVEPGKKDPRALRSSSTSLTYEFSVEWFKEVSEPMLWHILWQFYQNGFMHSCDYHSDSYWLEKFQEKSVVYLFVNKIRDSPPGECSYLINSITSMLLSRTKQDSKLINFIAGEIFNLTFKHKSVMEKVGKKGLRSLIRCAEKFPSLVSLYISLMSEIELDDRAIDLIRGCSLSGWLFDEEELATIENWLLKQSLITPGNKIARLIISKILLNSPLNRPTVSDSDNSTRDDEIFQASAKKVKPRRRSLRRNDVCFVDLKMRRRLALLLYNASCKHYPNNNEFGSQSLGASVEVAFGAGLYCEPVGGLQYNLLELATDTSYQQFYTWVWKLLFTLRLHILDQPETDWNDVQSRSGTSRSIKNTVIMNDQFHPVPSIEDTECAQLKDGLEKQNPIGSFIYLILTDATWQAGTLDSCIMQLNILANSGHITPSLMAMKYLTICHLNNLLDVLAKEKKCIDYFAAIILSDFDATRLASLISTQLDRLKQYRQLQLSHFYIRILLEVNKVITKRVASSWFSNNEVSFEKIACLLDHLVRFNFPTQRLEIIRKFYECAHVVQDGNQSDRSNSWLGSLMSSNSIEKDLATNLHLLSQKFKKYTWLQWVNAESDALRLEKIWEDIVLYLSTNEEATLDSAIKKVCPSVNPSSLKSTLPIFSWIRQIFEIMESDLNHPLCPLIWYNFFLNYFANSLNGVSVGFKLISQETISRLMTRLDSLYNYHTYKQRNWSSQSVIQQNSLTSMYKAYKLWLQDQSLRDAYIDIDRLREDYLVPLLKAVMESPQADVCLKYIDIQSIETQNRNLMQVWIASTRLTPSDSNYLVSSVMCFENTEATRRSQDESLEDDTTANDAISLIVRGHNTTGVEGNGNILDSAQEELAKPLSDDLFGEQKYMSTDELMDIVKKNFQMVFEEASMFSLNVTELERNKGEILDLVQQLYINKRREFLRVVPCAEGNECPGPARIKLEAAEALMDERKSQCIQDRKRQCQELLGELLFLPKNRIVKSTVIIEDTIRRLISDPDRSKLVIETLLRWLSEPSHYNQLNGSYHAANYLLKSTLDILSTTDQVDTFNQTLINVCLEHPGSVQILSPHLSPATCSALCFLELYKIICSQQTVFGSMATFVLLSKFDLNSYLNANSKSKQTHHEVIKITCSALKGVEQNRDDNYELLFDLFKRHLQIELAPPSRRQPDEFLLALKEFLPSMSEHALAPNLWLDYLAILGLDVNLRRTRNAATLTTKLLATNQRKELAQEESSVTIESVAEDVARLAETQLTFNYETSSVFMKTITDYMKQRYKSSSVTLLELFQDYLEQFGVVMLSATFMWLKTTSDNYPDNHGLIWKQFIDFWSDWVLLKSNCQRVSKTSYSLITSYFVVSLRYMMYKIPQNTCAILQSILAELTNYIVETREVVHLELAILQRCLKNLPWSSLIAKPVDINNLAALSEQDNYNVSDLVSHVISEMNTKESLARIQQSEPTCVAHVVERLATVVVLQSSHLKGYKLYRRYLGLIPVGDITRLATLVLARTDFNNPELSYSNKLLMELFRYTCVDSSNMNTNDGNDRSQSFDTEHALVERFERADIYAQFMSNYLVELIKCQPQIFSQNGKYLNTVMDNSLADLEPMLSSEGLEMDQKAVLYASLLKCCSYAALEPASRLSLANLVVESNVLRNKPKLVVELIQVVGQFLEDSMVLVQMVERLVGLLLNISGRYHNCTWANFSLRSITDELFLHTCIEERAPLAMMVYFESLFSVNQLTLANDEAQNRLSSSHQTQPHKPTTVNQIWSRFFLWLTRLTQCLCNSKSTYQLDGSKLTTTWVRILVMFEGNLRQFLLEQTTTQLDGTERSGSPCGSGDTQKLDADEQDKSVRGSGETELARNLELPPSPSKISPEMTQKSNSSRPTQQPKAASLKPDHECLLSFIKQMISLYDSINTSGLWSYLKSSTKSERECKVSVTALAIASFLSARALILLEAHLLPSGDESSSASAHLLLLRDELTKVLRACLSKLEAARKTKSLLDSAQFIETLIESIQQHEKVQYNEGVQLIETYARAS